MFCQKCGTQLPEDAMFCTNCGVEVKNNKKVEEKIIDNEVQLNVKPTFKIGYIILSDVVTWALFFILLALVPALMFAVMMESTDDLSVVALGTLIFIIPYCLWLVLRKKQYENYSYDFYNTKVIYKDGFINKSEKEVKYKYIREVSKRESFIQRCFGLGTITLHTNAETGYANGINIINVENVEEIYKKINEIIDC